MSTPYASWAHASNDLFASRALLYRIPLFRGLPAQVLDQLAAALQVRNRGAGAQILTAGEPSDTFYVLARGRAKIVLEGGSGREVTLALLRPGDFFGEGALLDSRPASSTTVVALD